MSACINTNISMKGSLEELLDMIKVLEDSKYLSGHMIKKKDIKDMSEEELKKLIEDSNNEITIDMMGPYGKFKELSDTKIFETLADISPNAYFMGTMQGFIGSSNASLTGKLENKKLYLSYSDTSSVGGYDSYMKYLDKVFPKKKFCKLFKIDLDDLDEEDYEDFFTSEYLDMIDIDDFMEYFSYSEIEEDEFIEAQEKFEKLNIYDYSSFETIRAEENAINWVYDPVNEGR